MKNALVQTRQNIRTLKSQMENSQRECITFVGRIKEQLRVKVSVMHPSGCPFPIFCSSGTDGLDGPPTGRRAAAGELNSTLTWVGFDNFIRTHLDIPSARFSPSTQRESREGFHGARLDICSSATGETGDQNNNAAPDWQSASPRSTDYPCSKDARPRAAPNTPKPSRPLSPEAQTVGTPTSTHDKPPRVSVTQSTSIVTVPPPHPSTTSMMRIHTPN